MRKAKLIAFTEAGCRLALQIAMRLEGDVRVAGPPRLSDALGIDAYESLEAWTADAFARAGEIVFVGAAGIAVRAIAPHVEDKFRDPAVVCVDELGRVAVPLLSGHVGGANDLAREIAHATGGIAAISTATDLREVFAVDEFARDNGLAIAERGLAKEISAALLAGQPVSFGPGLGAVVSSDMHELPFARTLHLVPRDIAVGVGCRRGIDCAQLASAVDSALAAAGIAPEAVAVLATIDVKADEPAIVQLAGRRGWRLAVFTADELAGVPGDFSASSFVRETVGVDNVCERAAVAAGGELIACKRADSGVTVALARFPRTSGREAPSHQQEPQCADGVLFVVGIGPGDPADMTHRAHDVLESCDVIVGYAAYIDLVAGLFPGKELLSGPMRTEAERCRTALAEARVGKRVALICSGDAGVYGLAGLCLEMAAGAVGPEIKIVAGVTAATSGAALLGAPIGHDFAVVSLSDLLTPWSAIEARLDAAARADFALCLYNPSSRGRPDHLRRACDVLLRSKPVGTVCGIARGIGRAGQETRVLTLGELRDVPVDMSTTVFVGNSHTMMLDGNMVTPRGYRIPSAQAGDDAKSALVFGGTSEGRKLVEWLAARRSCEVVVSSATEYGGSLVPDGGPVTSLVGRLDPAGMAKLMGSRGFSCVVDATHPYAVEVSGNIAAAAAACGIPLIRLSRSAEAAKGVWAVPDMVEAARAAAASAGNVLLTTGSKELPQFVDAFPDFAYRLFVRVLPTGDSLERVLRLGIPAGHVIAMQGPFSAALNKALIEEYDIALMVTKAAGAAGGFGEKVAAARECGIPLVVIERPTEEDGLTFEQVKFQLETRFGL